MSAYARKFKFKFVNLCKLYFPSNFNHEIGTKASIGESDSHLISLILQSILWSFSEYLYGLRIYIFIIHMLYKINKKKLQLLKRKINKASIDISNCTSTSTFTTAHFILLKISLLYHCNK